MHGPQPGACLPAERVQQRRAPAPQTQEAAQPLLAAAGPVAAAAAAHRCSQTLQILALRGTACPAGKRPHRFVLLPKLGRGLEQPVARSAALRQLPLLQSVAERAAALRDPRHDAAPAAANRGKCSGHMRRRRVLPRDGARRQWRQRQAPLRNQGAQHCATVFSVLVMHSPPAAGLAAWPGDRAGRQQGWRQHWRVPRRLQWCNHLHL